MQEGGVAVIPDVVIDPSSLWLFQDSDDPCVAEEIWSVCRPWLQRSGALHRVLIHHKSVERLYDQGLVPSFAAMGQMVTKLGLDGIVSAREISHVVDRFLSNLTTLEEACPIVDVLFEGEQVHPDFLSRIDDDLLREHSRDSLFISSCNKAVGCDLVYAFPRATAGISTVSTTAHIAMLEKNVEVDLPEEFDNQIQVVRTEADYRSLLDAQAIWDHARDEKDIKLAIALTAESKGHAMLPNFRIGASFMATLEKNQAKNGQPFSSQTLTRCFQLVVGSAEIQVNEFKTGKLGNEGGGVRVRTRDGAKAYRVHVTEGKVGLRLMAWLLKDGSWELANIGPKKEEIIENG